jgi:hypothetical protein
MPAPAERAARKYAARRIARERANPPPERLSFSYLRTR